MTYLPCVEVQTNSQLPATAAVIWLHGLGSDGHDFASVVPELRLPTALNVRFVFPHAPSMPVTINKGYVMPSWYDIVEASLDRKVDVTQLCASAEKVIELIEREVARGISSHKIVLAGFSQGGAVVYQAALSCNKTLGGLLVLSSYFATSATLVENAANKQVPILIQHGTEDPVVHESLGQRAYRELIDRGYKVAYESYVMEHNVCALQIMAISKWLQARLQ